MTSESLTWLHLTDLHVGMKDGEWLWPGVEEELLCDLERLHNKLGGFDVVFFTGDLTQEGSAGEFTRFNELWATIRQKLHQLGSTPVLLAVPGNHDLVRPAAGSAVVDGLRHWGSDADLRRRFWTQDDCDYRRVVRGAFDPWSDWAGASIEWGRLKDVRRTGLLPGDFAATIEKGRRSVGVLGLNTAALQLAAGDYRGRLSVHPRQASALVGKLYEWAAAHDACVLLTHHDPEWLDSDGGQAWNGDIAKPGRFAVHLCGHRHQQRHTVVMEGGELRRTTVIGRSLFGLEHYEHEGNRLERLHGFSVGRIAFGGVRTLRFWPRWGVQQQAGHRVLKADQSEALRPDEGTEPVNFGPSPRRSIQAAPPARVPMPGWDEISTARLSSLDVPLGPEALAHYYDGQDPGWAHALAGGETIPRRGVVGEVVSRLRAPATRTLILLLGAGGEGKSTAIRQSVVDLVRAGRRVLWRSPEATLSAEAVLALPADGGWVLASDDAELVARELELVLRRLRDANRSDVHFLLCARDTDWAARFRQGGRSNEPAWGLRAALWPSTDRKDRRRALGLDATDARQIVRAWAAAGSLGCLSGLDEPFAAKVLLEAAQTSSGLSDATLFGAVLEKRFGAEGLKAHLETVLHRLDDPDHTFDTGRSLLDAFLYTAAAEAVGIDGVDLKVIADLVGVSPKRRREDILNRLGLEAIVAGGGEALRTRAPAIARLAIGLAEQGRVRGDVGDIFIELVQATGRMSRTENVGRTHGAIMNCGPTLAKWLPELGIARDRAVYIACRAADEAEHVAPNLLRLTVTRAHTYRVVDRVNESTGILRSALYGATEREDWQRVGRGFLYELAVSIGMGADASRLMAGLWLTGVSIADGMGLEGVTGKDAKLAIAGLGAACLELNKASELPLHLRRLLRAANVLGPLVTAEGDEEAVSYFRNYGLRAQALGVGACAPDQALAWLVEAVRAAEEDVVDEELRESIQRIAGASSCSFRELARSLELAPPAASGASGGCRHPAPRATRPGMPKPGTPLSQPSLDGSPVRTTTPTLHGGHTVSALPRDVINVLADHYNDTRAARAVWTRAGGRARDVEDNPRSVDLWQNLWQHSERGASVRPAALIQVVLEDLPHNSTLIGHLATLATPQDRAAAKHLVDALEAGNEDTLTLLDEWEVNNEPDAFAAICPAIEGRLEPLRRDELRETLSGLADELKRGAFEGAVKAGTSEAVKAILAALAATVAFRG